MSRTLMLSLLALMLPASALAADDYMASGGGSVLVGPDYWSGDNSEQLRISLRGEAPLVTGSVLGASIVAPLDLASSASDGFGWEQNRMLLEFTPTFRARLVPSSVVRPYADVGLGPWFQLSRTDTVFGDTSSNRQGLSTTAALGVEIGPTKAPSPAFVLEPLRMRNYFVGDNEIRTGVGGMIGVALRY